MWNNSDPIWVSLRHLSPGSDAVPVQWSLQELEKQGGWSPEGCRLVHTDSRTSTMGCTLLSNYAVLQVGHASVFIYSSMIRRIQSQGYMVYVFFLGGAWIPQHQHQFCEDAPPCGLRLHCSPPPLCLHNSYYTHSTSQVLQIQYMFLLLITFPFS